MLLGRSYRSYLGLEFNRSHQVFEGNPTRFLPEGITVRVLHLIEKIKTNDMCEYCASEIPLELQAMLHKREKQNKQQFLNDNN